VKTLGTPWRVAQKGLVDYYRNRGIASIIGTRRQRTAVASEDMVANAQSRNDSFCTKFIEMAQKHFLTVLNLDETILLGLYRG
jgi:hypothetical protein